MIKKNDRGNVELLIVAVPFVILLLGSFMIGKLILARQEQVNLTRMTAFKDSFGELNETITQIESMKDPDMESVHSLSKSKNSGSENQSKFPGFISKIIEFILRTKKSQDMATVTVEKRYGDFLNILKNSAEFKEYLLMDDETLSHSAGFRTLLYGIALAKMGLSGNSLEPLGQDLLGQASEVMKKEGYCEAEK